MKVKWNARVICSAERYWSSQGTEGGRPLGKNRRGGEGLGARAPTFMLALTGRAASEVVQYVKVLDLDYMQFGTAILTADFTELGFWPDSGNFWHRLLEVGYSDLALGANRWFVFGPVEGRRLPRFCLLATSLDGTWDGWSRTTSRSRILVWRRNLQFSLAYNRLINIEKKIKRDWQFAQKYSSIMKDYAIKGYAMCLERHRYGISRGDKSWYLPHFGVENPNKSGKIPVLFDATARVG